MFTLFYLYRWIPAKEFFSLPSSHPAEACTIKCTDYSLEVINTTLTGRIVLTNLLIKLSTDHLAGKSFNGKFTLDQILVNDKLKVDIAAPFCSETTLKTRHHDFVRVATDFLPLYAVKEQLPGFFLHLKKSLKVYIDNVRFGASMLQKFHNFITVHPALKASLVRLAVIDDIYTAHQSISRTAKRLLQQILTCDMRDWRTPIMGSQVTPTACPVHRVVYQHHIDKGTAANDETSDVKKGDQDEEPFPPTLEGGMVYLRHVHHHGAKGGMVSQSCSIFFLLEHYILCKAVKSNTISYLKVSLVNHH